MENYMRLLIIVIWRLVIGFLVGTCPLELSQLAPWNLGQLAPASFFYLQQANDRHVWNIYVVDKSAYSVKGHSSRYCNSLLRWKRRLMSITWKLRVKFYLPGRKCKTRSLVKTADAITEHWTRKELAFADKSSIWPVLLVNSFLYRAIVTTCP